MDKLLMGTVPMTVRERRQAAPLSVCSRQQEIEMCAEPLRTVGGKGVFFAEFGVTSYDEIAEALDKGRYAVCVYDRQEPEPPARCYLPLFDGVLNSNTFVFTNVGEISGKKSIVTARCETLLTVPPSFTWSVTIEKTENAEDFLLVEDENGNVWHFLDGEGDEGDLVVEDEDGNLWHAPSGAGEADDIELEDGEGNTWHILEGDGDERGTLNYNRLRNKPTINGVEISGDHDSSYYGITHMWFGTRDQYNALPVIDPTVCYCIKEGS